MSDANLPASPPRPAGRRSVRLIVWLVLLATVGSYAFLEAPREVARWYLAAAQVEREQGHKELADQYMAHAQRLSADEPVATLTRAQWNLEDGNYEAALQDCNAIDERYP